MTRLSNVSQERDGNIVDGGLLISPNLNNQTQEYAAGSIRLQGSPAKWDIVFLDLSPSRIKRMAEA